jgi:glycosyltransferase involved in cell wall biosynthesis
VSDEHLPALYRHAKLFLFPSFYEGFGLPVLEALACGTPVISSNLSSLPEVVGEAGILIDPHSIQDLAQAIDTLLTDQTIFRDLKKQTIIQADQFSWKETAQQTLNAFSL